MFQQYEDMEDLKNDCKRLAEIKQENNDTIFRYRMVILIENFKQCYIKEHIKMSKEELLDRFKILDELIKSIE